MPLDLWLTFVAASVALLLIPGPTVLLVLSYAISKGRNVAVACALGVAVGDFIAMTASLAGLGAIVMTSAALFIALKWMGAIYLVWLGVKMLRSTPTTNATQTAPHSEHATSGRIFRHAAAVTALNPKSIAFFIAFVPQFLSSDQPLPPQFVVLIATFVTLAALNALAYALMAGTLRTYVTRQSALNWTTRIGGLALIGMGTATALVRRQPL